MSTIDLYLDMVLLTQDIFQTEYEFRKKYTVRIRVKCEFPNHSLFYFNSLKFRLS